MDRATRRHFYNLCDPAEALLPGDPRNVDVDALGVRGLRWAEELASPIELSSRPVCELFTGLPGAGVTTELLRLAARLGEKDGPNLLVVHIDAAEVVDLVHPIDTSDMLLAVLQRTEEAVARASGAPLIDPLRRLHKWIASVDVEIPGKLTETLRMSPAARDKIRARVEADLSSFLAEVRDELTLLNHRARRAGHGGVAVIFDGLEKLSGMSTNRGEVLDSAERVFASSSPVRTLPVHVVYTLPPALIFRLEDPVRFLPWIALADRAGGRREAGFEAARTIIRRRVPEEILDKLFGASERSERVDELIAASAGSPREIVRLLQVVIAEPSCDGARLKRLLSMSLDSAVGPIPESARAWLARVQQRKDLITVDARDRAIAESMLASRALVRYQDDEAWFDVHPAARRALDVVVAAERRMSEV